MRGSDDADVFVCGRRGAICSVTVLHHEIGRIEQAIDLHPAAAEVIAEDPRSGGLGLRCGGGRGGCYVRHEYLLFGRGRPYRRDRIEGNFGRSEEHTSELQSLMRISYAVFCLKKKKTTKRLTSV